MTLLFAACEQVLAELEPMQAPDEETLVAVAALRDHIAAVLPHYGRSG